MAKTRKRGSRKRAGRGHQPIPETYKQLVAAMKLAANSVAVYKAPPRPWFLRAGTPYGIVKQWTTLSGMDHRWPLASARFAGVRA